MKSATAWLSIVLATTAPLLTSCPESGNTATGGTGGGAVIGGGSAGGANFLVTDYPALSKWLDERFDVDYKHMTPQLIFDQVPLNDIYYQTSNLPTNAAPFNFSNKDISRRELLRRIASHWNLKMSFAADASGNPSAVKVEG